MLGEMTIEQFALIDHVRLGFAPGLNVLTGETGAGKSIILDALQAVLGGRAGADMVRTGAERAAVAAVFDLQGQAERIRTLAEMGIAIGDDCLLVLRREINRSGRGRYLINGQTVTAAMLKQAGDGLADLHGQHEHQSLLQAEKHLDLLDQYGGSLLTREGKVLDVLDTYGGGPIMGLRQEVAHLYRELQAARVELQALLGDDRDRARREDLLRFQRDELEAARLRDGEEEELEAELRLLANAEKLKRAAAESYAVLYEGAPRQQSVTDLLGKAESELRDAGRHDPALLDVLEFLAAAQANVQEASHFLAQYRERVDVNPALMAQVEKRLEVISGLKRKYGDTVAEMLRYQEQVQADLHAFATSEERAAELKAQEAALGARITQAAARLTQARQTAAKELSERVGRELAHLGMARAQFAARVDPPGQAAHEAVGPKGWDRVEFLFSPNVGEPPKPLAKVASGGEMSRIMLALKVILARVDNVPTLVFDEVDTGISGRTAQAVAEKLAGIARDRQVLCVTHLPQVAAMADQHFMIAKEVVGERTLTRVEALDEEGRTLELARMIGGTELTKLTLDHAREMVRAAAGYKEGAS